MVRFGVWTALFLFIVALMLDANNDRENTTAWMRSFASPALRLRFENEDRLRAGMAPIEPVEAPQAARDD